MSVRYGGWIAVAALAVAVGATIACGAQAKRPAREFDSGRAFGYLQRQVEFGPRIPGTPAHEQAGDWIAAQHSLTRRRTRSHAWRSIAC